MTSAPSAVIFGKYGQVVVFDRMNHAEHCQEGLKLRDLQARNKIPQFMIDHSSNRNAGSTHAPSHGLIPTVVFKVLANLSPFSSTQKHDCPDLSLLWPNPDLAASNGPLDDKDALELRQAIALQEQQAQDQKLSPDQEAHISQMKGRLSLIHQIPREILQEIFNWGDCYRGATPGRDRDSATMYPWKLAHVSRYWREVSLATPELWICLPVLFADGPSPKGSRYTQKALERFQFILQHAKNRLLHVAIHETEDTAVLTPNPALDLLVQNCDRWASAQLNIKYTLLDYIHNKVMGRLPELSQLHFAYQQTHKQFRSNPRRTAAEPWDTFMVAPKLTIISLRFWQGIHTFTFPRGQVNMFTANLNGHCGETELVRWVMDSSETLQHLILYSIKPQTLPSGRLFSDLTILQIDKAFPGALNAFTVPYLEQLIVLGTNPRILGDLLSMLQRSHFAIPRAGSNYPLKRLTLKADGISEERYSSTLNAIFCYLSSLSFLEIDLPSVSTLLRLSTHTPYSILPELETVTFRPSGPVPRRVYAALNAFARSRCEKVEKPRVKRFQFLMILPYCSTFHAEDGFMHSYYVLEETFNEDASVSSSDRVEPPSNPVELPKWAQRVCSTLPDDSTGGRPITDVYNLRWHVSQLQTNRWITAIQKIQWQEVDIRNYQYSRIYRKLNEIKSRLSNTPAEVKVRYPHLLQLESQIEVSTHRWKTMIEEQLPSIHWVIRPHVYLFLHSLFYMPQDDEIRSREDAHLIVDDDVDTRVSQNGVLDKYYQLQWRYKNHYAV